MESSSSSVISSPISYSEHSFSIVSSQEAFVGIKSPLDVIEQLYQIGFPVEDFYLFNDMKENPPYISDDLRIGAVPEVEIIISKKLLQLIRVTLFVSIAKCVLCPGCVFFDLVGLLGLKMIDVTKCIIYSSLILVFIGIRLLVIVIIINNNPDNNLAIGFAAWMCLWEGLEVVQLGLIIYMIQKTKGFNEETRAIYEYESTNLCSSADTE